MSLEAGRFPSPWKVSHITPIHKKGSKANAENYRGVAILSAIPKLFESLVYDRLYPQIARFISPTQHGFFRNRSVATNLCEFTTRVTDWMKSGYQVDCVYTDMSKAFDVVGIKEILTALNNIGVTGNLLEWLKTYLTGRIQYVRIGHVKSSPFVVNSGVPQGSHLGPLLFLLVMNLLPELLEHAQVLIYADDVKLFYPVRKTSDCERLQKDLERFTDFCNRQQLTLNTDKCSVISFTKCSRKIEFNYTVRSSPIPRVEVVRDLGVYLDAALTFNDHINSVVSEGLATFGVIRRFATEFDDPYTIRSLYLGLVRSKFDFASVVWRPTYLTYINKLEGVQKRFVKFAVRNLGWRGDYPDYEALCNLLNVDTVHNRQKISAIIFFCKLTRGLTDSDFLRQRLSINTSNVTLRNRRTFQLEVRRANYTRSEPAYRFMDEFNNLRGIINDSMTIAEIKQRLSLLYRRQLYLV